MKLVSTLILVLLALASAAGVSAGTRGAISPGVLNVKDFGATGDGRTDDTAAIQKAVNKVIANGVGTVMFPSGTYSVLSVNVEHGVTLLGEGGATIKRPTKPAGWSDAQWANCRTFITSRRWNAAYDSPPLVLRNLTIDGNRDNQGAYNDYQMEQASLLWLYGNPAGAGRLRVVIAGCTFRECVGDAISVSTNVDVVISDCYFSNCFRGGIVVVGGYSKLRADNCIIKGAKDARGIDFEVAAPGYGGSNDTDAQLSSIEVNSCFDMAVKGASKVVCSNISWGDVSNKALFNIDAAEASSVRVGNSRFLISAHNRHAKLATDVLPGATAIQCTDLSGWPARASAVSIEGNRIYYTGRTGNTLTGCSGALAHSSGTVVVALATQRIFRANDVRLTNCLFTLTNGGVAGGSSAGIDIGTTYPPGAKLIQMSNCHFRVGADANLSDEFYALDVTPGDAATQRLMLDKCTFGAKISRGVNVRSGGFLQADSCRFDSAVGVQFMGKPSHIADIRLNKCTYGIHNNTRFIAGSANAQTVFRSTGM